MRWMRTMHARSQVHVHASLRCAGDQAIRFGMIRAPGYHSACGHVQLDEPPGTFDAMNATVVIGSLKHNVVGLQDAAKICAG